RHRGERRALAGAVGPEQQRDLAAGELEVERVDRDALAVADGQLARARDHAGDRATANPRVRENTEEAKKRSWQRGSSEIRSLDPDRTRARARTRARSFEHEYEHEHEYEGGNEFIAARYTPRRRSPCAWRVPGRACAARSAAGLPWP